MAGGLTLDAGALIAADRNDRQVWAYLRETLIRGSEATVPTAVIVQAWRGPRSANLARLLAACAIDSLDEATARAGGELCGRSATADAIDAVVIVGAARRGDAVLTSDPGDLAALAAHVPQPPIVIPL